MSSRHDLCRATLLALSPTRRRRNGPSTSPCPTATGRAVPDLTAGRSGGEGRGQGARDHRKAAPASAKMRLTLAVEERLIADTSIRQAMFAFMKRLIDYAEIRLITIGLRNHTVAAYTGSLDVLVGGHQQVHAQSPTGLATSPRECSKMADHYADSESRAAGAGRAGVVGRAGRGRRRDACSTSCGRAAPRCIRRRWLAARPTAGASATLTDQSGREQVLGDGPKQSGGRRIEVPSTGAFPRHAAAVRRRSPRAVRDHLRAARRRQAGQALRHQQQAQGHHAPGAVGDSGSLKRQKEKAEGKNSTFSLLRFFRAPPEPAPAAAHVLREGHRPSAGCPV